jgi:hypothetical protein
MSSVATHTRINTRTHTATHLADVVLGCLGDLLAHMGIDASRFQRNFDQNENAISAWIEEGSLAEIVLECHRPNGAIEPIFEFPVTYDSGGSGFIDARAAFGRYLSKVTSAPAGSRYELICTFNGEHTPQTGWDPANRASTQNLRSTSLGTLGQGPHAGVSGRMRY